MKRMLHLLVTLLLRLRYRVKVTGLDEIADDGRPILFLPNHPALIDPVIVMSRLWPRFAPRPLADAAQVESGAVRRLTGMVGTIVIPDLAGGDRDARDQVQQGIDLVVAALERGENVLLYPAGRLMRDGKEDLGANSAVHQIVGRVPDLRIVMLRSTGLWGSGFSRARGIPSLAGHLRRSFLHLLACGLFFMPRRPVTIEVREATDFPRQADKMTMNRYLEAYYNRVPQPRLAVPTLWWQGGIRELPEPKAEVRLRDTSLVPAATRELVLERIRELAGVGDVREEDHLARDLALDSLVLVEFGQTLVDEFGVKAEHLDGLETVADCLLAAAGIMPDAPGLALRDPAPSWHRGDSDDPLDFPDGASVAELFLAQVRKHPDQVIVADQVSGEKTYRQLLTAVLALLPIIDKLPGTRIGIMLPGSVAAVTGYLGVMFAGREPVLVNWTAGCGQVDWCLRQVGVRHVLTSKVFLGRLRSQGFDPDRVGVRWLALEDMVARLTLPAKVGAALTARFGLGRIARRPVCRTAAILFTSGSEARPKAVPLTHANFLANGRDFSKVLSLCQRDRLLGILPVFHSLGLAGTVILPLCTGLRTVYWPNPTEGRAVAQMAGLYGVTTLITTPTFLAAMLERARQDELNSLRLVFAGAEKCPESLFGALAAKAPEAVLCEGYGVTECSPVITVNDPADVRPGTIGRLMPSLSALLLHPETGEPVAEDEPGRLLVRGESVFSGYLDGSASSPFLTHEGREWYDTGDLVVRDREGLFRFAGRLKRFVKLGGEMISLPAIEEALLRDPEISRTGVRVAVLVPDEEHPELVLVTTGDLDRQDAARAIGRAGLSALHNPRQVVKVAEFPLLGSGKTDYRRLAQHIEEID